MKKSTMKKAIWLKSKTQGASQEAPSALVFKELWKDTMPKIFVRETFERCYELEVADLNEDTVQLAIDNHNGVLEGDEPQWIGTEALTEDGDEILSYWP